MTADTTPVLVVGAGPTGLMLALWLARAGVRVRIVDRAPAAATESRALVMHARSLEFYQQLGLADVALARGRKFAGARLWSGGRMRGRIALGDIGTGLSPFPFMLILPQDEQERLLAEALQQAGVSVERGVELVRFDDDGTRVLATLRDAAGRESACECAYLAGCDGAHSAVRHGSGVGFAGEPYARMFYVADVQARGDLVNGELNLALDTSDFMAVFPLPQGDSVRLIGTIRNDAPNTAHLQWEDVSHAVLRRLPLTVERVNWFSTYRVHHRVADRFRTGRAFLLGDAGHIHSPVGGQGMNTGLGDAVNLAWKLAMVVGGRAPDRLLDTYEPERIAFARRLVATTDRAFTFVTREGALARVVREDVAPWLVPDVLKLPAARRFAFRAVSQIMIEYRKSALSSGQAGDVHGGDRLPWTGGNFAPLASRDWQAHVYGEPAEALRVACATAGVALHAFPGQAEAAGLPRGAVCLVRPDGYIGLVVADPPPQAIAEYFGSRELRPQTGRGPGV